MTGQAARDADPWPLLQAPGRLDACSSGNASNKIRRYETMKNINPIITAYLAAKAEESAANKKARDAKARAEAAAAEIKAYAAGRVSFETDAYTVALAQETRVILDQPRLFADFPGIKDLDQYGKESTRDVITAIARAGAPDVKTA